MNRPAHGPLDANAGYCRSHQREATGQAVVDAVKQTFRDLALLLKLVELSDRRTEPATDTTKLKAQFDRLEAKRPRLIDLYTDGDITKAEYQKRLDAIEGDGKIEAMLPTEAPALDARLVKALVKYFAGFEHRQFEEQRQIRTSHSAPAGAARAPRPATRSP